MSLSVGEQLGPYKITALIGKGGMGEVYRAQDPRLGRDVAIKVSAQQFTERFEREARLIASLNHPNVCTLYDVGPNYLVMEFVEGEPPKGPLPLDRALAIASQIAQALDAAHEKGITHRDLKPGNVMVREDGTVKVLDFGLAKVSPDRASSSHDPENSPTVSLAATQPGVVLGTAAYMSPEQARGREDVDHRADIWAYGVVLYELLTGERPFKGSDLGEVLASVIKEEPDLSKIPAQVRPLIARCLVKDPKKRLRDIGDMDLLLNAALAPPASPVGSGRQRKWLLPASVALAALVTGGATYWMARGGNRKSLDGPVKLSILPPPGVQIAEIAGNGGLSLSPDGRSLAFVGDQDGKAQIYVRSLDSVEARAIPGTEGAERPVWSPDGRSLVFTGAGGLRRIDVAGGSPQVLAPTAGTNGQGGEGAWSPDGKTILFTTNATSELFQVPASGGQQKPATALNTAKGESSHLWPEFLPDGKHFLFHVRSNGTTEFRIDVGTLGSSERKTLLTGVTNAHYAPPSDGFPGYLLYVRDGTLMAQQFDADRVELIGDPRTAAPQVSTTTNATAADFTVAPNGVLAYRSGGSGRKDELAWFDRSGKEVESILKPETGINFPRLSPDGKVVAYSLGRQGTGQSQDVWTYDLVRKVASRFTFNGGQTPAWSPDGARIAYSRLGVGVFSKAANSAGAEQVLWDSQAVRLVTDWSSDGNYLLVNGTDLKTAIDIWMIPVRDGKSAAPLVQTPATENGARFMPNGGGAPRLIAYQSSESGRSEVYATTLPGQQPGKWQISSAGGSQPLWRRDGRELFYVGLDNRTVWAVDTAPGPPFRAGTPRQLFRVDGGLGGNGAFDVAPDGQRFLMVLRTNPVSDPSVTVVLNWQAALGK